MTALSALIGDAERCSQVHTSVPVLEDGFAVVSLSPESHHLIAPSSLPNLRLSNVLSGRTLTPQSRFCPATVFHLDAPSSVLSKIAYFLADGEFDHRFLEVAIIVDRKNAPPADLGGVVKVLSRSGCNSVFVIHDSVPEGPYFVRDQSVYRSWRLFPDIYEAFQLPTVHQADSDGLGVPFPWNSLSDRADISF